MTEEVKDAKKGYEESSGHSNGPMVVPEDPEKAFARTTKYERRVKFFAHIILAIGIICAAYNLYNNYEAASRRMDFIDQASYSMSSEQIGAAKGGNHWRSNRYACWEPASLCGHLDCTDSGRQCLHSF